MTSAMGSTRQKLSMIASVTNRGKARWMISDKAFDSDKLIEFLETLIQTMGKRVPVKTKAKLPDATNQHITMLDKSPQRSNTPPVETSWGRSNRSPARRPLLSTFKNTFSNAESDNKWQRIENFDKLR